MIHGDIKGVRPSFTQPDCILTFRDQNNILIHHAGGHAVITDLGLAVYDGNWSRAFHSLREGNVRWLAPEHQGLLSPVRPTTSSDIYAFAITCVEVRAFLRIHCI